MTQIFMSSGMIKGSSFVCLQGEACTSELCAKYHQAATESGRPTGSSSQVHLQGDRRTATYGRLV
jgi:hypothetical protein